MQQHGPGPQDAIAEITKVVKIPVIANGGIESRHCAHRMNDVEYLERGYYLELYLEIVRDTKGLHLSVWNGASFGSRRGIF